MSERALVFGTAAEAYERHRLGYPDAVVDLTLAYARAPVGRALEVGAGTGKATRLFARGDLRVTALEPEPAMADVLRRTTAGLGVEVVVATFEAYEALAAPADPYDLLVSASAWHWTDPVGRWDRTAMLLRPGATVALLGSTATQLVDGALDAAVEAVQRRTIPDGPPLTSGRAPSGTWWPGSELEADPRFADVEEHDLARVVRRTREEHLGTLGTLSAYLQLPDDVRARLLSEVGEQLPDEVEVDAQVRLHLARRV